MVEEDEPLSADALRLLDRQNTGRSSVVRNGRKPSERASARYSHIRRWTQGPDEVPTLREEPACIGGSYLQDIAQLEEQPLLARACVHSVPDDTLIPSKRSPLSGVQEMLAASTTLSEESEMMLGDKAVTLAVTCAGWILMLQVFVHVCVCVYEKERESKRKREKGRERDLLT